MVISLYLSWRSVVLGNFSLYLSWRSVVLGNFVILIVEVSCIGCRKPEKTINMLQRIDKLDHILLY